METESPGDKLRAMRLHRWAERHRLSVGMATMAQQLAVGAEWAYQVMSWLRDREIDRLLPQRPVPAEWLRLYRGGWRVLFAVADRVPQVWGNSQNVEETLRVAGRIRRAVLHEPQEVEAFLRAVGNCRLALGWRKAMLAYWRNLGVLYEDLGPRERKDTAFGDLMATCPELQFFLLVTLRCFIEYEESPDDLMKQARAPEHPACAALAYSSGWPCAIFLSGVAA